MDLGYVGCMQEPMMGDQVGGFHSSLGKKWWTKALHRKDGERSDNSK